MHAGTKPLSLAAGLTRLVEQLRANPATLLLFGPSGCGKSALAAALAARLDEAGQPCHYLSADVGAPAFGVPAAVNLGTWGRDHWRLDAVEAVCSLNAARFRLPLVVATHRLLQRVPAGSLLIEAPGLVRGVAAAELLTGLCDASGPSLLVVLTTEKGATPLPDECLSLPLPVLLLQASPQAQPPRRHAHRNQRTELWNAYLQQAREQVLQRQQVALLGTPPPLNQPQLWQGLLVGLCDTERTLAMGEILALEGDTLRLCCPPYGGEPTQLLVRDAGRDALQNLVTREPAPQPSRLAPSLMHSTALRPGVSGPLVSTRDTQAELVNGVYEDPLLLLSLRQSGRCLLFDLGDTGRIPLRLLHRVSDIFISHAHIDHIGGFMGLLRARLGAPARCRLYGPPGLVTHISGYLSGVLWDRIGEDGPCFEVTEIEGDRQQRYRLQAGRAAPEFVDNRPVSGGVLLQEPNFQIRAIELDHRTPVLAYAFEPISRVSVSEAGLEQLGWPPGPWLSELKRAERDELMDTPIRLPDGQIRPAAELSARLLELHPGDKLVYATDLADTPDNRRRLVALARDGHSLFCEACFTEEDRERAERHGHLTTRACGEIAAAAAVQQLIPFHFSRRYEADPERPYREIEALFSPVIRAG